MNGASRRVVTADVLTPIGAYAALAQPRASCLLESVESGGRISRYSFIGLDYGATEVFAGGPDLYDRVRGFVESHRPSGTDAEFGGALLAFSYDAARSDARLNMRPPSIARDAGGLRRGSGHVAGLRSLHRLADDLVLPADDAAERERRIDGYIERLLAARPALPNALRARGPMHESMGRERFLALVAEAKRRIYEGDGYQLQLGIRFLADSSGTPFDLYRAMRRAIRRRTCSSWTRRSASCFGASPEFLVRLEGRRRASVRSPGRGRAAKRTPKTPRSRPSCWPTKRSAPST